MKMNNKNIKFKLQAVFVAFQDNTVLSSSWWGDRDLSESSYLGLMKSALHFLGSA